MNEDSNLQEYRQPDLYDLENPEDDEANKFYLWLANSYGGPILDLGCGTGRVTIPLARNGFEITGLDIVPEMLDRARAKATELPVHWVEADTRAYHLGEKYRLILENGSVFMHMLTREDQSAFLERVREHLAPGGVFTTSMLFPHPDYLHTNPEEKDWYSYTDDLGREVKVSGTEAYDELLQIKTETAIRRIMSKDGEKTKFQAPLSLRYTFPQEMEALLAHCGFQIAQRFGGMDWSPLTNDSRFMVFLCCLKGE